jgi:transcription antitermination factor NusG
VTHTTKKWFAVYTKPRWEKKVHRLLQEQQLESYCPLNKIHRKWSDRIKMVQEPLFKSYVFVRIREEDKTNVRMTDGVVNFVYWLGKPAQIKNSEIETIKRFLNEYEIIEAVPLEIKPDTKVRISGGVLMDHEATVRKVRKNRVEVIIESLGYSLVASINKSNISVIGKK